MQPCLTNLIKSLGDEAKEEEEILVQKVEGPQKLGGGNSNMFFMFIPKIGGR